MNDAIAKASAGQRISRPEALELYEQAPTALLGRMADAVRRRKHPRGVVSYIIDNDIPGQVAKKGELVERRLHSLQDRFPNVAQVRGKGLMWAVEFKGDIGERITNAALAAGLILNNVRPNAVRIVPPLTVTEEELEQGLAILEHVIAEDAGIASK